MQIIDFHCDALWKLWQHKGKLSFRDADEIDTNKLRLIQGKIKVQCFAIFTPATLKEEQKFQAALDQAHYFHREVLGKNPEIKHIKDWADFDRLQEGEIGALLTLEGVDAIGSDLSKLELLYSFGVRSIGLTWNHANLAADGILEPRGAGLTLLGKNIVQFNNQNRILTDVSHLSEAAFWDVMELAHYPIASHSNAKAVSNDPRNLSDEQAIAMFAKGATVHIVYYPPFVEPKGSATIDGVIRHIDHFGSLGGVKNIGFGSDFDGISIKVEHLEHAGMSQNLINELLKRYKEEEVRGFAYENFLRRRPGF